jgi:hypothetical protein
LSIYPDHIDPDRLHVSYLLSAMISSSALIRKPNKHVEAMSKELGSIRGDLEHARAAERNLNGELHRAQQNLAGVKGMYEVAELRATKAAERVKFAEAARDEAQAV